MDDSITVAQALALLDIREPREVAWQSKDGTQRDDSGNAIREEELEPHAYGSNGPYVLSDARVMLTAGSEIRVRLNPARLVFRNESGFLRQFSADPVKVELWRRSREDVGQPSVVDVRHALAVFGLESLTLEGLAVGMGARNTTLEINSVQWPRFDQVTVDGVLYVPARQAGQ